MRIRTKYYYCVRRRKNALLMRTGVEIYGTTLPWMDGSWDSHLASPAYFFAGADDITKKREPGIEIIERTPKSLIITSYYCCGNKTNFHMKSFALTLVFVMRFKASLLPYVS